MPTPVGYVTDIASYRQSIKDFGTALSFNGSSGIVTLGTANPFTGSFYFSGWINWKGLNGGFQTIFAKRDSYAADGLMFSMSLVDTTGLLAFDTVTSYVSFNYRFPVGKPTYMTWVHDTVNAKDYLYINGILTSTQNIATLGTKTDALISIGGTQSPVIDVFNGEIDEVCIGTSAPTYEEVIKMYAKYVYPSQWSYLKFDEGTGSTATDSSGNGNNGTITTASYVTSKVMSARSTSGTRLLVRDFGTCLSFDGVSNRVAITPTLNLPIYNANAFSITGFFKVKPNWTGGNYFYSEGNSAGNAFMHIGVGDTTNKTALRYRVRNNASSVIFDNITTTTRFNPARWNHFAVTDNNGSVDIYLNGINIKNSTYTRGATTIDISNIGCLKFNATTGNFWQGLLDEITTYNKKLSATEIANIYYSGIYPSSNLVSFWKMDEESGTTLLDFAGNGNTGTITGATYSNDVVMKVRTAV